MDWSMFAALEQIVDPNACAAQHIAQVTGAQCASLADVVIDLVSIVIAVL